jgi:hypothetical protein
MKDLLSWQFLAFAALASLWPLLLNSNAYITLFVVAAFAAFILAYRKR